MSKIAETIKQSLQSVQDELQRIQAISGNPGEIDVDLALDRLKEAYSNISNLKAYIKTSEAIALETQDNELPDENSSAKVENETSSGVGTNVDQQVPGEGISPQMQSEPEDAEEMQQPKNEPIEHTDQTPMEGESVEEKTVPSPVSEENQDEYDQNLDEVYSNSESSTTSTIYDKISSGTTSQDLASKLQKNPIQDLKEAIGLHKKYRFINELFEGNHEAYAQAISDLNNAGNSDHGVGLLSELKQKYGWPEEELFFELKELVVRRHGMN